MTLAKKKTSSKEKTAAAVQGFEQSLEKLERIVHDLEEGGLGLGDALARYEEGVKHLRRCYQALQQAERRIEVLAAIDDQGNAVTRPFDEDADATLQEKAQSRSRRRSEPPDNQLF